MIYFITGISTEVGKTMAAAIVAEALKADYWKPIQAGDLEHSDSHKVADLVSNTKTVIHKNSYALHTPMSPHAAAAIDQVEIRLERIIPPKTNNHLVIEGAGGLLVPLNDTDTILDLIQPDYKVIIVSRHYLGSINHTLLTVNALVNKGLKPACCTIQRSLSQFLNVYELRHCPQYPKGCNFLATEVAYRNLGHVPFHQKPYGIFG